MHKGLVVIVSGTLFSVTEKSGYLKADMGGVFGWTAVWGQTMEQLYQRIKKALADGPYGAPTGNRQ
jgi:hypothetical protein